MKKIALLFLSSVLLLSCGSDKKKESTEIATEQAAAKDNFSVVLQAIYEKDDNISLIYKKGGFWDYDHPITHKVTGQPTIQKFSINIPEGEIVENVQITLSTNKEQKNVTVKSVSIFNNNKEVFNGDDLSYVKFFNSNSGLIWDEKNLRNDLNFDGQYPPGFVGTEELESLLIK